MTFFRKLNPIFLGLFFFSLPIHAQECMWDWANRVPVEIDNSDGETLSDYQVRIVIDTETPIGLGLMEPDGSDLRVTMSACCDPLCYYIESGINTPSTVIWVKIPVIEAGSIATIYAFFGNPGVEAVSDAECTFAFYEDFDDDLLDFEFLCGSIDDSTITDGDYNLTWTGSGMMGSYSTFPFDEAYTAEAYVNSSTGNWPGIFWAKSTAQKSYGLMTAGGDARISLSGGGSGWCTGHNWASSLETYADDEGIWSLTWVETGNVVADFPTVGAITSGSDLYAKNEDLRLVVGGISYGVGGINLDWIRVRKYAENPPTYSVGELDAFSPAPVLALPEEVLDCGETILDAGPDYATYEWSSGGTESVEIIDVSDTYYLTVVDDEGCIHEDSTVVLISPEYHIENGTTICIGESYEFADGTVIEDISEETVYTSNLITVDAGCDSIIVTTIEVYEYSPILDLGEDIFSCGDSVFLDAGEGFGVYEWTSGGVDQIDTVLVSGIYGVTVIDDNGCEQSDEINVSITDVDNGVSVDGFVITSDQAGATYQWLDCALDYEPIIGEDGMSFVPVFNGSFAVEVTLDDCVDTSECVTIAGIGIKENAIDNYIFSLYPNPTTGMLSLDLTNAKGSVIVEILSVDGQQISKQIVQGQQIVTLEIDEAPGIYYVSVQHDMENRLLKLVKE